jgi:hypothetical protein
MEVKFLTTCVTIFGKYVKGRTYTLKKESGQQFIKEGLAEAVKKPTTTRKSKAK